MAISGDTANLVGELWPWALLLGSTLFGGYFLIGYPLLLRMTEPQGVPVAKDLRHEPTVSVLMAVHNGEVFLADKLDSLLGLSYPVEKVQILVLGDGCTDGSEEIARRYGGRGVQYVALPRGGKGAALNAGLERATGEILFFTDVRQKLDPQALRELVGNFADPRVGAATGKLVILKPGGANGEQADMDLYWRYELWVRRWHSAEYSLFNTTGCIYAMRRELCRPLREDTLIDDAEIPLQAYRAGYRIVYDEGSIAYDYPTAPGGEWRRRMRTMGGMWQVFVWHPDLLLRPHRMWLHFVSHKLGRLLLPWALIGTVVGTLYLPEGWIKTSMIAGNLALGGLALGAKIGGKGWSRLPFFGRIGSLAWTFLSMNIAALFSVRVFLMDPRRMWGQTTKVEMKNSF